MRACVCLDLPPAEPAITVSHSLRWCVLVPARVGTVPLVCGLAGALSWRLSNLRHDDALLRVGLIAQPGTPYRQRLKSEQYNKNIERRGKVPKSTTPKKEGHTVGPVLLAFFLFVVVGSGACWRSLPAPHPRPPPPRRT